MSRICPESKPREESTYESAARGVRVSVRRGIAQETASVRTGSATAVYRGARGKAKASESAKTVRVRAATIVAQRRDLGGVHGLAAGAVERTIGTVVRGDDAHL